MVFCDLTCTEKNTGIKLLLEKPDGTKFLAPTKDQREQYIDELVDHALTSGTATGLWRDYDEWVTYGMEAVQRFLIDEQKLHLAYQLQKIATKLASGTAHISPQTPKVGPEAPTQDRKRKHEEDFQELEGTFLEASQMMRDFKRVKQNYQPIRASQPANQNTSSASNNPAPTTQPSGPVDSPEGDSPMMQAKVAESTGPQATISSPAIKTEALTSEPGDDSARSNTAPENLVSTLGRRLLLPADPAQVPSRATFIDDLVRRPPGLSDSDWYLILLGRVHNANTRETQGAS
jgi:hypothetical protein